MRSPFSTFPNGWPGVGLLLLRLVVGAAVVTHGWRALAHTTPSPWAWIGGGIAVAGGITVAIGFLASAAGAALGLCTVAVACGVIPSSPATAVEPGGATILFVSICLAIALLGPGALSVDARRRGRREVVLPPGTSSGSNRSAE